MTPSPAWVALSLQRQIGGTTFRALQQQFDDDLDAILRADAAALKRVPGIGARTAAAIAEIDLDTVAADMARWQAQGVAIIDWHDASYPARLHQLPNAPPTLYRLGHDDSHATRCIAVVGTRRPSSPARTMTHRLVHQLAGASYGILSGLALGIDQTAHEAALEASHTSAVLGSGVLNIYPPQNADLAERIIAGGGALYCECAPDATVNAPRLVARNRLIAAMAYGVIVVESSADGGAMHAARSARRIDLPVATVALPADGNRYLIDEGATALDGTTLEPLDGWLKRCASTSTHSTR